MMMEVKNLFGDHQFHHVIERRLAELVKISIEKCVVVHPEYQDDYRFF
jgi:hypothetical protein